MQIGTLHVSGIGESQALHLGLDPGGQGLSSDWTWLLIDAKIAVSIEISCTANMRQTHQIVSMKRSCCAVMDPTYEDRLGRERGWRRKGKLGWGGGGDKGRFYCSWATGNGRLLFWVEGRGAPTSFMYGLLGGKRRRPHGHHRALLPNCKEGGAPLCGRLTDNTDSPSTPPLPP